MEASEVKAHTIESLRGLARALDECGHQEIENVLVFAAYAIKDLYMSEITYGYFEGDFAEGLLEIVHELDSDATGSIAHITLRKFMEKYDETGEGA